MENNQINNNGGVGAAEKKHKTHFAISLAIIATALVIACIIAIVTIVGSLGQKEGLSYDGSKLNGKTPDELYSDMSDAVEKSNNYSASLTKHGIVTAADGKTGFTIDISTHIESMMEGDNFYYKKTIVTKYVDTSGKEIPNTTEIEIRVVDGIAYIDQGGEKLKKAVDSTEYKKSFDILSEIVWEDADGIFKGAKLEESNGGFTVSATAVADELLAADARDLFAGDKGALIFALMPVYSNENYTVVYDADERPITATYSYIINDQTKLFMSGEVGMSSTISYGDAVVRRPSNTSDYVEITD